MSLNLVSNVYIMAVFVIVCEIDFFYNDIQIHM